MPSIKSSQVLIGIGVLVVLGIAGYFYFQVLQGTPSAVPVVSKVFSEPKTIGIISFRQQAEAVQAFKDETKRLGYTNVTYKEITVLPDNMMKDSADATKKLVGEKVDVIYTPLEFMALAAIQTTKQMGDTTPIVFMAEFHDPIKYGLAQSFRSSGNNATGLSISIIDSVQKQLEFLKIIRPDAKKIGVFADGFMVPQISDEFYPEIQRQAAKFGIVIVPYTTNVPPPQAEAAWNATAAKIKPGDIDAIYHFAGHFFDDQQTAESQLATRLKVPMIAPLEDMPNGGHFGYSADYVTVGAQSARIMDKIFHGAKPSDIPIQDAEKYTLIIDPSRASTAGVVFPESILSIAGKVITNK